MSTNSPHLLESEIKAFVAGDLPDAARQQITRHLTECAICRRVILGIVMDNEGKFLKARGQSRVSPGCPESHEWTRLAAGIVSEDRARALLGHAAGCDFCGVLLKEAQEIVCEDLTSEELEQISKLPLADAAARRQLADRMTVQSTAHLVRVAQPVAIRSRSKLWRPVLAVAAVVLVVIGAWFVRTLLQRESSALLLAQAYTQERTFELRVDGAAHAPVRLERGPARSRLERPAALIEAEARIARDLQARPDDLNVLAVRGRAELLEWQYEAAARTFEDILSRNPDNVGVLVDLATAHFQRAEAEQQPSEYGAAVEALSHALEIQKDNAVALFNRAIAYEKLMAFGEARRDWERFLQIEKDPAWLTEANERLDSLKKKVAAATPDPVIEDPSHFVVAIEKQAPADASWTEQYLDVASSKWLPDAAGGSMPATHALRVLGRFAAADHGDRWINDALHELRPELAPAWSSLQKAFIDVRAGRASDALKEARSAQLRFDRYSARAGGMRASLEILFALQRSEQWTACSTAAGQVAPMAESRSYGWVATQANLEWSNCAQNLANLPAARRLSAHALQLSHYHSYGILELRALALDAYIDSRIGNSRAAWRTGHEGLQRYFNGSFPPARAFSFYSDLSVVAETLGYQNTALAYQRETLEFVVRVGNMAMEAVAHYRLGALLAQRGDSTAAHEFQKASGGFQRISDQPEMQTFQTYSEIGLASLALQNGNIQSSRLILEQLRADEPRIENLMVQFRLHRALADVAMQEGRWDEARTSLEWIINRGYESARRLQAGTQREAWLAVLSDAAIALSALEFESNANIGEAIRSFHWQLELQLEPSQVPSLADFRLHAVRADTVEIGWLPVRKHWIVWLRSAGDIRYSEVRATKESLSKTVDEFRRACADPKSDLPTLRQSGNRLFRTLFGELANALPDTVNIVLSLPEPLAGMPTGALVRDDGAYLAQRYHIWTESGGRTRNQQIVSKNSLALAVATGSTGRVWAEWLPPLPDAEKEAVNVASSFVSPVLLLHGNATVDRVLHALPNVDIFHFAGHTYSGAGGRGLLLTPDSAGEAPANPAMLTNDRLEPLTMKARLAVLSSCETAGAGLSFSRLSLARLFLQMGTEWVVATNWNMDSAASATFMDVFYSKLTKGDSVPGALQTAADSVRANPVTQHPYYWAVFVTYGPH